MKTSYQPAPEPGKTVPAPSFVQHIWATFLNDHFYNIFTRPLSGKAGLRKIRIHDLRHRYATVRIGKGDNIADVSGQLGHHSIKLTLDIYYHHIPGKKKAEVDGLDDAFITPGKVVDRV